MLAFGGDQLLPASNEAAWCLDEPRGPGMRACITLPV
jgi:hypothetical protein